MLINGIEYAWGDIGIFIFGQKVGGALAIEYSSEQDQDYIYGAGRQPRAIGAGNCKYPGTLTILQSEYEALNRTARSKGYKNLMAVSMDIVVMYGVDGIITMDKIACARFNKLPKGQKQGDLKSEHVLPFNALDIIEGLEDNPI